MEIMEEMGTSPVTLTPETSEISEGLEPMEPETSEPEEIEIESLGTCNILKVHDDGDLTVLCGGKRYMVTPEGDIFEETLKGLEPEPE